MITFDPEGVMNVCTIFRGNPMNSCFRLDQSGGLTDRQTSSFKK